ncbi:MAG: TetR/AcrR family transcriptional regulator C-terminal domain-containing protein [Acidimicrobiales bacterium]|jgi:AcrR family transcriptional regulator
MPRPRSLDHGTISAAGLAVVDRDGLAALSMRAVAVELGVGTMTLYRYVTGREEIERLIADRVFRDTNIPTARQAGWQRQVRELSEAMRSAISAHIAVIPLLLVHFPSSPDAWRWLEELLRALTKAGFSARERVIAVRAIQAYLIGSVQSEYLNSLTGDSTMALASMPAEEYPLIVETARMALSGEPDDQFAEGLTVVLKGLDLRRGARTK